MIDGGLPHLVRGLVVLNDLLEWLGGFTGIPDFIGESGPEATPVCFGLMIFLGKDVFPTGDKGGPQLFVDDPLGVRQESEELSALNSFGVVVSDAGIGREIEGFDYAEEGVSTLPALEFKDVVNLFVVNEFVDQPTSWLRVWLGGDFAVEEFAVVEVVGVFVIAQFVLEF